MALSDFLDELGSNAGAAVRGYGKGATLGLIQYPQALLKQAVNGGTFGENLADLRQSEEQLAQEHPVAYYGGNLVGGLQSAVGTGGGGLVGLMGRGAIQGGVAGFTQNEDLGDAAAGAGLGAALGGVARGVDKGRSMYLQKALREHYQGTKAAATEKLNQMIVARAQLQAARSTASPAELKQINDGISQLNVGIGGARGALKQVAPKLAIANGKDEAAMLDLASGTGLIAGPLTSSATKVGVGGTLGALSGAVGSYASGGDPLKGAAIGMLSGGAAGLIPAKTAILAKIPAGASETAARAVTNAVTPALVAPQAALSSPSQPSEPHPWQDGPAVERATPAAAGSASGAEPPPWQDS